MSETGGPAFPLAIIGPNEKGESAYSGNTFTHGMTLWDYFFAQALNGLLTGLAEGVDWSKDPKPEEIAADIADAMIQERSRRFNGQAEQGEW